MNANKSSSNERLLISYLQLRRNIGYFGVALPISLILGGGLLFGVEIQSSISAYYYTGMRGIFVGILWAIGVFLFSYKGYSKEDNWVANIAGISATLVALFPTDPPGSTGPLSSTALLHFSSAGVFLLSLAYFSLFLFVKTDHQSCISEQKRVRNSIYRFCGYIIIAALLLLGVFNILPEDVRASLAPLDPVFWLEAIAVFAFSGSWFVKGEGILKDHAEANKAFSDSPAQPH